MGTRVPAASSSTQPQWFFRVIQAEAGLPNNPPKRHQPVCQGSFPQVLLTSRLWNKHQKVHLTLTHNKDPEGGGGAYSGPGLEASPVEFQPCEHIRLTECKLLQTRCLHQRSLLGDCHHQLLHYRDGCMSACSHITLESVALRTRFRNQKPEELYCYTLKLLREAKSEFNVQTPDNGFPTSYIRLSDGEVER